MSKDMCESCMMPLSKDPKGSQREHEKYCSYCFTDGKLCYEGNDVKEFKKAMVDAMVDRGEGRMKARFFAFLAVFAPRWKNKLSTDEQKSQKTMIKPRQIIMHGTKSTKKI
ncbi:MAG: hypothetical protein KC736_01325 [Candidatus Moranbacteria bacterium]|nr:hypothetical protein [Candidatus Moranbacteria bacterium]